MNQKRNNRKAKFATPAELLQTRGIFTDAGKLLDQSSLDLLTSGEGLFGASLRAVHPITHLGKKKTRRKKKNSPSKGVTSRSYAVPTNIASITQNDWEGAFRTEILDRTEVIPLDITASDGLTKIRYELNPGNALIDPWGANIANMYENYSYLKLNSSTKGHADGIRIKWIPTTGPLIEGCTVGLCWKSDTTHHSPTSVEAFEQTPGALFGTASLPMEFVIPISLIKSGTVGKFTDDDPVDRLENSGFLTFGSWGGGLSPPLQKLGIWEITYRVRLSMPSTDFLEVPYAHFWNVAPGIGAVPFTNCSTTSNTNLTDIGVSVATDLISFTKRIPYRLHLQILVHSTGGFPTINGTIAPTTTGDITLVDTAHGSTGTSLSFTTTAQALKATYSVVMVVSGPATFRVYYAGGTGDEAIDVIITGSSTITRPVLTLGQDLKCFEDTNLPLERKTTPFKSNFLVTEEDYKVCLSPDPDSWKATHLSLTIDTLSFDKILGHIGEIKHLFDTQSASKPYESKSYFTAIENISLIWEEHELDLSYLNNFIQKALTGYLNEELSKYISRSVSILNLQDSRSLTP